MQLASRFGASANRSNNLAELRQEACLAAAEGLNASFAKFLIYDEVTQDFMLGAEVGFPPNVVQTTRLSADSGTAVGVAWRTGQTVISDELGCDYRFHVSGGMLERVSFNNIAVPVIAEGKTFGVIEVETLQPASFLEDDIYYLQSVALSLAVASNRLDRYEATHRRKRHDRIQHEVGSHEMEHRIRNDLQGVYASIEREVGKLSDPLQRFGYGRISRQVLAIADLYEHLRVGASESTVDLGSYLATLCSRISAAADLSGRGITLEASSQAVCIAARRAGPLGIAVNELVANAAEHAFPDKGPGMIVLRMTTRRDLGVDRVEVTVSDDGCGFKQRRADRDGLDLAELLVQMAGGALTRLEASGTTWRITLASD